MRYCHTRIHKGRQGHGNKLGWKSSLAQCCLWGREAAQTLAGSAHMMSPKNGSRQAMKHPSTIRAVLQTKRTMVFLKHHTGACRHGTIKITTSKSVILTSGAPIKLAAVKQPLTADTLRIHHEKPATAAKCIAGTIAIVLQLVSEGKS